jgi:hypothetical protein
LVYIGHCIVRTPSIYGFWLLLWYILVIVLSVSRLFTASDYFFGIFYPLYWPYFVYLRLLITPFVYFGHCIVCTSSIYCFWLLLWYILVIVLSVRRLFTASDYFFGIFWSLYCPYFVYLRLLITALVYFGHCIVRTSSMYGFLLLLWYILVIVLSVRRLFTASDYFFGIFWSLYCPYFVYLRFWLLLWYILVIVLSVLRLFTAFDYFFGICWSLYYPYCVYLRLLITSLVYFVHFIGHTLANLRLMITHLVYFGYCIVRTSSVVCFGHCIVRTSSMVSFGHCIVRTSPMVYFSHCIVHTSSIYDLW